MVQKDSGHFMVKNRMLSPFKAKGSEAGIYYKVRLY
jgi:hypothetical protein